MPRLIENNLTRQTRILNFMDYIDMGPLKKVKPDTVRMIIPSDQVGEDR